MFSWFPVSWVALINNPVFLGAVLTPLGLILLDVLTGIAASLHAGSFDGTKIANFLGNGILQYIGATGMIVAAWLFQGSTVAMTLATTLGMGALATSTLASIYQNLSELLTKPQLAAVESLGASLGYPAAQPVSLSSAVSTPFGAFQDQRTGGGIGATTGIVPVPSLQSQQSQTIYPGQ